LSRRLRSERPDRQSHHALVRYRNHLGQRGVDPEWLAAFPNRDGARSIDWRNTKRGHQQLPEWDLQHCRRREEAFLGNDQRACCRLLRFSDGNIVMSVEHFQALPKGVRLNQYEMIGILGAGGLGITYMARDTTLDTM